MLIELAACFLVHENNKRFHTIGYFIAILRAKPVEYATMPKAINDFSHEVVTDTILKKAEGKDHGILYDGTTISVTAIEAAEGADPLNRPSFANTPATLQPVASQPAAPKQEKRDPRVHAPSTNPNLMPGGGQWPYNGARFVRPMQWPAKGWPGCTNCWNPSPGHATHLCPERCDKQGCRQGGKAGSSANHKRKDCNKK